MSFSSDDSTPNRGLNATMQAPRELGDSQDFLETRVTPHISLQKPESNRLLEKLITLRKRKKLSDCLELLQKSGFCDDVAIFILSWVGNAQ